MFLSLMKKIIPVMLAIVTLASCSEYQKILKSEDMGAKYAFADSLYDIGKYRKSIKLWDQIVPSYRGKPQAERIMFLNADALYQVGDYYLSGYQFDRFVSSYPDSQKAEEAQYKAAMSYAALSPNYQLDQSETEKGLDQLQLFITAYPESEYAEQASERIQELSVKLQKKSYEIAKGWHKIMDYPTAIAAFDDFLSDYPGSPFREAALFYKFDSQYQYGSKSISVLVKPRLNEAIEMYETLIRYFPEGEYREEADALREDIDAILENYS
ncbi:MAG: outer membrane protein assembly factor BamD [Leeuwenhoekiella sp.]|nr:outer membrane protein assembly factor BamD [Leeuwenhoekiella sp.]MBA82039.1 outer membrane protein assembly factor BamD [Leeuwenhoekiella sp.]|tara:strand:- start:2516 stop:3322 length:807 start_codon:yes stop_codon:yes gene_type:complete